jgi:hypothetical protein
LGDSAKSRPRTSTSFYTFGPRILGIDFLHYELRLVVLFLTVSPLNRHISVLSHRKNPAQDVVGVDLTFIHPSLRTNTSSYPNLVVSTNIQSFYSSPGPVALRCAAALCLSTRNALFCLIQRPQGTPKGATCISRPLPAHHAAANLAHHHASDRPCQDLPSHPPVQPHCGPLQQHLQATSLVPASAFITCCRHCPGPLADTGCTPE